VDKELSKVVDDVTGIKSLKKAEEEEAEGKRQDEEDNLKHKGRTKGPELKDYLITLAVFVLVFWYFGIFTMAYDIIIEYITPEQEKEILGDQFNVVAPSGAIELTSEGELRVKLTNYGSEPARIQKIEVWDIESESVCTSNSTFPFNIKPKEEYLLYSTDCKIEGSYVSALFDLALRIEGETTRGSYQASKMERWDRKMKARGVNRNRLKEARGIKRPEPQGSDLDPMKFVSLGSITGTYVAHTSTFSVEDGGDDGQDDHQNEIG